MSWKGGRTEIYHNSEINQLIQDILPHLQEEYEGPTDFFLCKLKEEKEEAASIQDKIEQQKKQKRIVENRLDELRNLQEKRNRKQQIKNLKRRLKSKQQTLKDVQSQDLCSVDERRKQLESDLDVEEFSDLIDDKVEEHRKKLEDRPDESELKEEISSIQDEICRLTEGDESDFDELFLEVGI